jgi:hypothetical protein
MKSFEERWRGLDYNKHSGLVHCAEWAVAATILTIESKKIQTLDSIIPWIYSSDMEYPGLPTPEQKSFTEIEDYIDSFYTSRKIVEELKIDENDIARCYKSKSRRRCLANLADRIEDILLERAFDNTFARYAGDIFMRIAIPDELVFGL